VLFDALNAMDEAAARAAEQAEARQSGEAVAEA
jgi:hypothetical protein